MHVNWDASTVVADTNPAILGDYDLNIVTIARERLIDGVIDYFIDQVMQTARAGRANVHSRAFSNGLEAFENLDIGRVIAVFGRRHI
jgi:hypothetical protein